MIDYRLLLKSRARAVWITHHWYGSIRVAYNSLATLGMV